MRTTSPTITGPDVSPDGVRPLTRGPRGGHALPGPAREVRAAAAEERAESAEQRAETAERRVEALQRALDSRPTIEQAKGLVMGVFGLDSDAAFEVLVWVSQHANMKLATVATRFLAEVARTDLGDAPREELTALLAALGTAPAPRAG